MHKLILTKALGIAALAVVSGPAAACGFTEGSVDGRHIVMFAATMVFTLAAAVTVLGRRDVAGNDGTAGRENRSRRCEIAR